jgi:hypothetical protein
MDRLTQHWCCEMPVPISPGEMQKWIEESLAQRPHIGLRKAVANMVLESHNPFDSRVRRKPRVGFALGAVFFAAAVICFCYFNLAG